MSDEQQPDHMRPIPDGGLKDAMPGWLKRPPAWRSMPTATERHERTLPEPDTSQIDPRTLLDVSDLPQWLQTIAARGAIPLPEPDASVDHAVEQVRAATSHAPAPIDILAEPDPEPDEPTPAEAVVEAAVQQDVPVVSAVETPRSPMLVGGLIAASVVIVALVIVILMLL